MKFALNNIFESLMKEVLILHSRWQIYEKIYGVSEERINLLNSSAPSFFYNLQFILLDDIELIIAKLLDPPQQGKNKNLCLETIILSIDDVELKLSLESIHEILREYSKNIREKRNKRLSHFDLKSSLVRPKDLFTKSSRKLVNDILNKMREYLNLIEFYYFKKSTAYELVSSLGDAESLINCLKRSEAYQLLEKDEQIEHGFWRTKSPYKNA